MVSFHWMMGTESLVLICCMSDWPALFGVRCHLQDGFRCLHGVVVRRCIACPLLIESLSDSAI